MGATEVEVKADAGCRHGCPTLGALSLGLVALLSLMFCKEVDARVINERAVLRARNLDMIRKLPLGFKLGAPWQGGLHGRATSQILIQPGLHPQE